MSESYKFDSGDTIRDLFKWMLKEKIVDAVIGFETKKTRYQIAPVAIEDPKKITDVPLSVYMVYNFARMNSAANFLHKKLNGAKDKKVALIARPCDIRGLEEISKRLQVNLDNLFLIGTECYGTLSFQDAPKAYTAQKIDFAKVTKESLSENSVTLWLDGGKTKTITFDKELDRWESCNRCPDKIPKSADLTLANLEGTYILTTQSDKGKDVLKKALNAKAVSLQKADEATIKKKDTLMGKLIEKGTNLREAIIAGFIKLSPEERFKTVIESYENCRRCGVCTRSCIVCFCKDCIVIGKKKELDPVLYCLTRLGHMGDSCVQCGKCGQNCPAKIPLPFIHLVFLDEIKATFGFIPGKKDEAPPRSGESIKQIAH
ncbi:MAG: Coenzyme F420 hydrogenase/dehydrogenase, beta subunit C-terminal domain [Candidatus Helarchaeota archaeon]|nr:Coenzyme F420 hydrogenase/dehydrogenase, beta subunit C-terminal domain [Candidatus Helarchaeota archaeon]